MPKPSKRVLCCLRWLLQGFCLLEPVSVSKAPWGHFFPVELKPLEFILEPGGGSFSLRIVERGKGYLRSIFLGRDGAFWLLSTVNALARLENSVGFIRTFRDSQCALLFVGTMNIQQLPHTYLFSFILGFEVLLYECKVDRTC